jgi:signal transduction histidine kinase
LSVNQGSLELMVRDDGRGFPTARDGRIRATEGRMGLTGMRERMHAVGGSVDIRNRAQGAEVLMRIPVVTEAVA